MTRELDAIRNIRSKIFTLAKASPDLETMHWYIALDDCFENDELQEDEIRNIKWRGWVLHQKKEPVNDLLLMIDAVLATFESVREAPLGEQ